MNLNEIIGEYLPFDESTTMKLARELYRGAEGDPEKAKKMLKYLSHQISANIDKYHKSVQTKRIAGERL